MTEEKLEGWMHHWGPGGVWRKRGCSLEVSEGYEKDSHRSFYIISEDGESGKLPGRYDTPADAMRAVDLLVDPTGGRPSFPDYPPEGWVEDKCGSSTYFSKPGFGRDVVREMRGGPWHIWEGAKRLNKMGEFKKATDAMWTLEGMGADVMVRARVVKNAIILSGENVDEDDATE